MTTTHLVAPPGPAARVLRGLAIASCLPYLSLKVAWVAGSRAGIPEGSVLLERPGLMTALNSVTVLMDAAVVVLALLLTQRWGMRVPPWLPAFTLWVATGLLLPIMVAYPLQLLLGAAGGGEPVAAGPVEPFLDAWVFPVVYGGFIVQGLTLGALFVRYARGRWGHLWRGTVWELPSAVSGPGMRAAALVASLVLLVPTALHVGWAAGMTTGLTPGQLTGARTDFIAREVPRILFAVFAVAGTLLLAYRRGRSLPVRIPLGLAWTGSAAVGCWGGWLLFAALVPADDAAKEPTALLTLAYAGEMITGLVLGCCVARFLRRRTG
ncbi:hypothetical protein ACFPM3_31080 [Streptomyces coeruleoprunus]|uniref:Aromatic ring-opening dioxygenase LigA n=1 Tax=Streptomyces coeruleoprunus TaxID=285563 RepID=A0ABV9XQB0_9ACTN